MNFMEILINMAEDSRAHENLICVALRCSSLCLVPHHKYGETIGLCVEGIGVAALGIYLAASP